MIHASGGNEKSYGKRGKWFSSEAMLGSISTRVSVLTANTLFFASNRPAKGIATVKASLHRIVKGSEWSSPRLVENVNSESKDGTPTVARDGMLYFFSDRQAEPNKNSIYASKAVDGKYTAPVRLPSSINSGTSDTSPFISPNGSVLLFYPTRRRGRRGSLCLP
jgi:hypothetical protein